MDCQAGNHVERRHGQGESRVGRILGRCHPSYDAYYVNVGIGMTHIDWARDLRLAEPGADLPLFKAALGHQQ